MNEYAGPFKQILLKTAVDEPVKKPDTKPIKKSNSDELFAFGLKIGAEAAQAIDWNELNLYQHQRLNKQALHKFLDKVVAGFTVGFDQQFRQAKKNYRRAVVIANDSDETTEEEE